MLIFSSMRDMIKEMSWEVNCVAIQSYPYYNPEEKLKQQSREIHKGKKKKASWFNSHILFSNTYVKLEKKLEYHKCILNIILRHI